MSELEVEACVFTSMHNTAYFSNFVYCSFGRPYGLVVGKEGGALMDNIVQNTLLRTRDHTLCHDRWWPAVAQVPTITTITITSNITISNTSISIMTTSTTNTSTTTGAMGIT